MNQLCKVCGEPAAGFHFGAFTCEGCKSFFGRTYNNVSGVSECKNGGRCEINKKNRTSCKSCRLRKCLQVGMSKSGSRYGRRSNWFKIHCLLSSQGQNGGMNSLPETNNNNSTVTNNNNNSNGVANNTNSTGVNIHNHHNLHPHHPLNAKTLPSTMTSHHHPLGGGGGGHHGGHSETAERGRERSSSSGTSHLHSSSNNSNSGPPQFPNLAAMSPDSKEQFLSSLNRKMMTPDLFEYFRAANLHLPPMTGTNGLGLKPPPFFPEERTGAEELSSSRNSRSPGSLESPNSEASGDEHNKGGGGPHLPLFGLPPGSPLDVKPNDILSFDLLTRDLMKLGYDPVRFWPAMLSSPSSLHQFNPYRFMFPNFPGGPGGGPPGFPPIGNGFLGGAPLLPPNSTNNGGLLPSTAKLLAAAGASAGENLSPSPVPPHTNRRFPITVPPASSLTLTPPISHHGSDETNNLSSVSRKVRKCIQAEDQPIDLSAKTIITNNNNDIPHPLVRVKGEPSSEDSETGSDIEDDEEENFLGSIHCRRANRNINLRGEDESSSDTSSRSRSSLPIMKKELVVIKSELRDSGQDEDEDEDEGHCDGDDESDAFNFSKHLHHHHHQQQRKRPDRRRSSSSATSLPLSKKIKMSIPLDLTRSTTNSNPPTTKIAS